MTAVDTCTTLYNLDLSFSRWLQAASLRGLSRIQIRSFITPESCRSSSQLKLMNYAVMPQQHTWIADIQYTDRPRESGCLNCKSARVAFLPLKIPSTMSTQFYGITIKAGEEQSLEVPEGHYFAVTMLTLEAKDKQVAKIYAIQGEDEKEQSLLSTLRAGTVDQQQVELNFSAEEDIRIAVKGHGEVHILGYVHQLNELGYDSELESDDEEAYAAMGFGGEDGEDSEDEDDEEEQADLASLGFMPPKSNKAQSVKKVEPPKKEAPKKAAEAPAKKAAPAKKSESPAKKEVPAKKSETPAKKSETPAKKEVPAKKEAPAKKSETPAKKDVVVEETPAKKRGRVAADETPAKKTKTEGEKKEAAPATPAGAEKCTKCTKTFKTPAGLKAHSEAVHKE
ncbi:hypothetical protein PROFUN_01436 [Planoprotostelium fungivorum]|uniref:C2H2-type domain-containing protein n=1 Tax=Planoprotostelium fungivorum TaxID=1890364 RepID=A0A2P6NT93_9EUKA|nr:hypothetical protein PROFUN_01436 [Planoprotostelium fungivorum]